MDQENFYIFLLTFGFIIASIAVIIIVVYAALKTRKTKPMMQVTPAILDGRKFPTKRKNVYNASNITEDFEIIELTGYVPLKEKFRLFSVYGEPKHLLYYCVDSKKIVTEKYKNGGDCELLWSVGWTTNLDVVVIYTDILDLLIIYSDKKYN